MYEISYFLNMNTPIRQDMEPIVREEFKVKKVRDDLRKNYVPVEALDLLEATPGDRLVYSFDRTRKEVVLAITRPGVPA